MFDLTNKVALVTGGGRGMGLAHALALLGQGAKVAVTDVSEEECALLVDDDALRGGNAVCYQMDVSSKRDIDRVFDEVIKQFGRLDILVNNAGVYIPTPALEMTEEVWDDTLNINLKGQFLCAQRAAKEMAKNKWGRIINISSVASGQAGFGIAGGVHYCASKGGVIAMTEALAVEWASLGINVNAVAPGAIDTAMSRKTRMTEEEMNSFLAGRIPLKRIGKSEEVAPMVVFLASEEASYVTGATFYVDGGWLAA